MLEVVVNRFNVKSEQLKEARQEIDNITYSKDEYKRFWQAERAINAEAYKAKGTSRADARQKTVNAVKVADLCAENSLSRKYKPQFGVMTALEKGEELTLSCVGSRSVALYDSDTDQWHVTNLEFEYKGKQVEFGFWTVPLPLALVAGKEAYREKVEPIVGARLFEQHPLALEIDKRVRGGLKIDVVSIDERVLEPRAYLGQPDGLKYSMEGNATTRAVVLSCTVRVNGQVVTDCWLLSHGKTQIEKNFKYREVSMPHGLTQGWVECYEMQYQAFFCQLYTNSRRGQVAHRRQACLPARPERRP